MKKLAALTLGAALCALPAFSQTGRQVANAPVAQPQRPPAFAQPGELLLEGLGGVNSSPQDRDVVPTTQASAGVQVTYGYRPRLALTGTFLFDQIGKVGATGVNAKEFEIGVLRSYTGRAHMEPYLRFDVGGIHQTALIRNAKTIAGDTQVMLSPGAGFLVPITRLIAFDFSVRAVVPAAADPLPFQIQALFGVVFRTPRNR